MREGFRFPTRRVRVPRLDLSLWKGSIVGSLALEGVDTWLARLLSPAVRATPALEPASADKDSRWSVIHLKAYGVVYMGQRAASVGGRAGLPPPSPLRSPCSRSLSFASPAQHPAPPSSQLESSVVISKGVGI